MIVTTAEIAKAFGVTRKTIASWVKKGMPKKQHGKFDLHLAIIWWADNIHLADEDTGGVLEAKEKYWAAKARREVVKADEAEGRVVPVDQVRDEAFQCGRMTRDAILNIPDRISAELASYTDMHQVNQMLTITLTEALEELSNMPDCIDESKK